MKKIISISICFFLALSIAGAQSNNLDRKMEKAFGLVAKGKIDEADEYMVKLLEENPEYGTGWDYLCKLRYKQYTDSRSLDNMFGGRVTVTTKDEDGKDVTAENDSLVKTLMDLINNVKPSKKAFGKWKYTMRKATLVSADAYSASFLLRIYFLDKEIDTAVSKKALKYFTDAEKEFENKNYNSASKLYKRAVDEQPDFYKASLYLGDCFYFMGDYVSAISSFKAAVEKFPELLEPRKYLVDSYAKEHLYDKAVDEAIYAMGVYPDLTVAAKLDDAAYLNNQRIDIRWIPRGVFPNRIIADSSDLQYKDAPEMVAKQPWTFYRDALQSMRSNCNDQGLIVKPNSLTDSKYLEVYSWEQMLKNSTDPVLDEARRMQKDGYLDCYVMVTCFHFDFYDQYADFVAKNRGKVTEYYKKYLVAL